MRSWRFRNSTSRGAVLNVAGPGIWGYKWRFNGGLWSSEVSLVPQSIWNGDPFTATMFDSAPSIQLSSLANGTYSVEVLGKNSAGVWQATPTLSRAWTVQGGLDADTDGMRDDWETTHGFEPLQPTDAQEDADGDATNNRDEFVQGTDPLNSNSVLRLTPARLADGRVALSFDGVGAHSYVIEASETLAADSRQTVMTFPLLARNGPQTAEDPAAASLARRFYRLATLRLDLLTCRMGGGLNPYPLTVLERPRDRTFSLRCRARST
ncbi:MAG: hypothetical protein ACR2OZ_08055 [Verrucomicrobiales bacterium]